MTILVLFADASSKLFRSLASGMLDTHARSCIHLTVATKTITLEIDAYERLKRAKRTPRESFSEVVRRLPMPAGAITAGQLLNLARERGAILTEADAQAIDELNLADQPPDIP